MAPTSIQLLLTLVSSIVVASLSDSNIIHKGGKKIGIDATDCVWEVDDHYIDLSGFIDHTVLLTSDYNYYYTPCADGLNCNYKNTGTYYQAMVTQYDQPGYPASCSAYIAKWDYSVKPTFSEQSDGVGVFTFEYINGQESQDCSRFNRSFTVNWICDNDVRAIVQDLTVENECDYTMNITTTYACH